MRIRKVPVIVIMRMVVVMRVVVAMVMPMCMRMALLGFVAEDGL